MYYNLRSNISVAAPTITNLTSTVTSQHMRDVTTPQSGSVKRDNSSLTTQANIQVSYTYYSLSIHWWMYMFSAAHICLQDLTPMMDFLLEPKPS